MNFSPRHAALALIGALACAGLQAQPRIDIPGETRSDYQCDGGTGFRARYVGHIAELRLPGGQVAMLQQLRSGSGFAYQGGGYSLRGKGQGVTLLKAPATQADQCRAVRPTPPTKPDHQDHP